MICPLKLRLCKTENGVLGEDRFDGLIGVKQLR